jgi:chromosome segregation ATPase
MSTITENDLKRLEDLIIASRDESRQIRDENRQIRDENRQKFAVLEAGITAVQKEISDLRVSVGKIEDSLQNQQPLVQKIPDLAEKVGELKNWRQLVIISLTALISGSITWVIRGGTLKP